MSEATYHRSEPPSIRDIRVSDALCDRRAYVEAHRQNLGLLALQAGRAAA